VQTLLNAHFYSCACVAMTAGNAGKVFPNTEREASGPDGCPCCHLHITFSPPTPLPTACERCPPTLTCPHPPLLLLPASSLQVDDVELFQNIIRDLFPNVVVPDQDHGVLERAILEVLKQRGLQQPHAYVTKVSVGGGTARMRLRARNGLTSAAAPCMAAAMQLRSGAVWGGRVLGRGAAAGACCQTSHPHVHDLIVAGRPAL